MRAGALGVCRKCGGGRGVAGEGGRASDDAPVRVTVNCDSFPGWNEIKISPDGKMFIEVSEWYNGEGFDVEVVTNNNMRFQLTHGQFDALKKLVKRRIRSYQYYIVSFSHRY